MAQLLRISATTAFVVLLTLLPFLPGRYDSLAVPLSLMSQILGKAGLLLVPVGALWLASGHWSRLAGRQRACQVAALVVASLVWVIVSLGAAISGGLSLGLGSLALWACVVFRVAPRLRASQTATPGPASLMALDLLVVPLGVALLQLAVAGPAAEWSRSRAIQNSAQLIADIEQYRAARGRYPASLMSLQKDYSPSIIGIRDFQYEPSGDTYNLCFEQLSFIFGTREIVVYNPRDEQVMTSHDSDLLRRKPEELERRRGYYAVHDTPHPHWKCFLFD